MTGRSSMLKIIAGLVALALVPLVSRGATPVYRTQTLIDRGFVQGTRCVKDIHMRWVLPDMQACPDAGWLVWSNSPNLKQRTGAVHYSLYNTRLPEGKWRVYLHDNGYGSGIEWSWLGFVARQMLGPDSVPYTPMSTDEAYDFDVYIALHRGSTKYAVARAAAVLYAQAGPGASLINGHRYVELEVNFASIWGDAEPNDARTVVVGETGPFLFAVLDGPTLLGLSNTLEYNNQWSRWSLQLPALLRWVSHAYPDIVPEPDTGWSSWLVEGVGVAVEVRFDGFSSMLVQNIQAEPQDIPINVQAPTPTPPPTPTPTPTPAPGSWPINESGTRIPASVDWSCAHGMPYAVLNKGDSAFADGPLFAPAYPPLNLSTYSQRWARSWMLVGCFDTMQMDGTMVGKSQALNVTLTCPPATVSATGTWVKHATHLGDASKPTFVYCEAVQ